jgi:DNA-binding MarR family transcriptional regulator
MDDLARDLQLAVGRVSRRLRRIFVGSGEGLAFLELAVLHRVARGETSPGTLATAESVTTAAVAAALGQLHGLGLVERSRDERDGRRVVVTATRAGREALEVRDTAMLRKLHEVLDRFTPEERARLEAVIPLLERVAGEL